MCQVICGALNVGAVIDAASVGVTMITGRAKMSNYCPTCSRHLNNCECHYCESCGIAVHDGVGWCFDCGYCTDCCICDGFEPIDDAEEDDDGDG